MSHEEIRNDVADILTEVAGVTGADNITDDQDLVDDLDVDSLSMVEVAVAIEDKFGVLIADDNVRSLRRFGDLVDYIELRISDRPTV